MMVDNSEYSIIFSSQIPKTLEMGRQPNASAFEVYISKFIRNLSDTTPMPLNNSRSNILERPGAFITAFYDTAEDKAGIIIELYRDVKQISFEYIIDAVFLVLLFFLYRIVARD